MGQHDTSGDDTGSRPVLSEGSSSGEVNRVLKNPVEDLSYEERLLIYRRREDLTQQQMADRLGVSRNTYNRLEQGHNTDRRPDAPSVEPLRDHEHCFIMRRRSGWSQTMCAEEMGISTYWFRTMEMGQVYVGRLVDFWNENDKR